MQHSSGDYTIARPANWDMKGFVWAIVYLLCGETALYLNRENIMPRAHVIPLSSEASPDDNGYNKVVTIKYTTEIWTRDTTKGVLGAGWMLLGLEHRVFPQSPQLFRA